MMLIMQFLLKKTQLKKLKFNGKMVFLTFKVHPRQKSKGFNSSEIIFSLDFGTECMAENMLYKFWRQFCMLKRRLKKGADSLDF